MAERLPLAIREALKSGPRAVFQASNELPEDLALLALWVLHTRGEDPEYGRLLAVRTSTSSSTVALACRLWLMAHDAQDLGVANTLLGSLEADTVELGAWNRALGGEVIHFLRKCLAHEHQTIRAGVLSTLSLASEQALSATLPAAIASSLAEELRASVESFADEEELVDLSDVENLLLETTADAVLPVAPRALTRVALDLLDLQSEHRDVLGDISALIDFVRRRTLLDDAALNAFRTGRPIQTMRVLGDQAPPGIIDAVISYGEAVTALSRKPEFEDDAAQDASPDFGTRIAWAPAASVPLHVLFDDSDARPAFELLSDLVAADGKTKAIERLIDSTEPQVALQLLRLFSRLKRHDAKVEVVLTDPRRSDFQRSVVLEPELLGRQSVSGLMKRARGVARGRTGVTLHKDYVPQANTVKQVFQAVDAMLARGVVTVDDIDDISSDRQVNYYRQGARVLGFFDEDNQPTGRARTLVDSPPERRLAVTSVYFEDSPVGRAWRAWAGKDRLKDVDPTTAQEFLEECVSGLTGTTPGRRASTLRTWFAELMPHYPH